MSVIHIVQFKFEPTAGEHEIQDVCNRLFQLKDKCIHPSTQKTYIKSLVGGRDNSPEGMQNGFTHAFVMEFECVEDRDHYVKDDPAHLGYVKTLDGVVAGAQVLDFTPGSI